MTHNPIINRHPVTMLRPSVVIPRGAVGLAYSHGQMRRSLRPDEQISFFDRLMDPPVVYIVDTRPQQVMLGFLLPDRSGRDRFPLRVSLEYCVGNAQEMVDRRVEDTEALARYALEFALRRECRKFPICQHEALMTRLETVLAADLLKPYGLHTLQCDAEIYYDDTFRERLDQIKAVQPTNRVPRMMIRQLQLPSKTPYHMFQVEVHLTYRVSKPDELPGETLAEVEERLWPRIAGRLRGLGRIFELGREQQLEKLLRHEIEKLLLKGYGITVVNVNVEAQPEESLAEYERERAELGRATELFKLREQNQRMEEQSRRERLEEQMNFVKSNVKSNSSDLLTMLLAQNPDDTARVITVWTAIERGRIDNMTRFYQALASNGTASGLFDSNQQDIFRILVEYLFPGTRMLAEQALLPADGDTPAAGDDASAAGGGSSLPLSAPPSDDAATSGGTPRPAFTPPPVPSSEEQPGAPTTGAPDEAESGTARTAGERLPPNVSLTG